ncbi:MAG: hypothetical protein KGL02_13270 [Acidobacteriota bacterium]|nr:hypothetical protein [Acidobacteriota bacterium]
MSELHFNFKSPPPDHHHIDGGKELRKPMGLMLARAQEIDRVVGARQKAIEAHSAEY